jgi:hypothetical protein
MQFAVVADGPDNRLAEALVDALAASGVQAVAWTSQLFVQNRGRVVGQVRVLFLGDGSVGKVMRSAVGPSWRDLGVRYGIQKRMGFLWTESDVVDLSSASRQLDARLVTVTEMSRTKRDLGLGAGHPTGSLVAFHYLQARRDAPVLRLTGRAHEERMRKRQLEYGMAHLLLHAFDAWLDVALTPVAQAPRAVSPPRSAGPSTGYVSYETTNLRNPSSSTAPPPPRRSRPQQDDERRAVRRELADLDEDLHRAQRIMRARIETLAELASGAPQRKMLERELEQSRRTARQLMTRQSVLRRQLDQLLADEDRTPRP